MGLSDALPPPIPKNLASDCACRILNERNASVTRNIYETGQVTRHPHLMHAEDRPCGWRYSRFHEIRINIEGSGHNVNKNGNGSTVPDTVCRGDVGVTDGNDFITRIDAGGKQGEMQGSGTIRNCASIGCT